MSTEWNFDAEEIKCALENASNKAGDLVNAAEEKIQEVSDAKQSMEDAQSDLDEAINILGTLPETLVKYDDALTDLESVEVYY